MGKKKKTHAMCVTKTCFIFLLAIQEDYITQFLLQLVGPCDQLLPNGNENNLGHINAETLKFLLWVSSLICCLDFALWEFRWRWSHCSKKSRPRIATWRRASLAETILYCGRPVKFGYCLLKQSASPDWYRQLMCQWEQEMIVAWTKDSSGGSAKWLGLGYN